MKVNTNMASINSYQKRVSDRTVTAEDMIAVAPKGQEWMVFSAIEGPAQSGGKTFAIAVYGCFANEKEAHDWNKRLTDHGMPFQTYITPTNVPLVLPPPTIEEEQKYMNVRYEDPILKEIMERFNTNAARLDEKTTQRIEELRAHEIKSRYERLLELRSQATNPSNESNNNDFSQSLVGKTDAELLEVATSEIAARHLKATTTPLPKPLPQAEPPRIRSVEEKADRPLEAVLKQGIVEPVANPSFKLADMALPLPESSTESEEFLRRFKESGGRVVCRLGEPQRGPKRESDSK